MKFSVAILGLASIVTAASSTFRRPDSHWDFIIKGGDVKRSVEATDAYLADYSMRGKNVDPASLGFDKVKQISGYLDDDANNKHLFYWFFESRSDPKNDPVILWLSGGPGCSSMAGLLFELGPAKVDSQLKITTNPSSWNSKANVIFIDQPIGAGFSYGDGVNTSLAASKDIYALLTLFFKQFPQYATQDFHIAGESYAGHYIPQDAAEIVSHNDTNINLKSILIGNGLTDAYNQYPQYPEMACGNGGVPAVLSDSTCSRMRAAIPSCQAAIKKCYASQSSSDCTNASSACSSVSSAYYGNNRNPYDMRVPCEGGNLCYNGMDDVQNYFNQDFVKEALGVEVSSYGNCNNHVNSAFHQTGDDMKPLHLNVPKALAKNIAVLIYAGDKDYICNWLGNQAWTNALDWPGHAAFSSAQTANLTTGNSAYGTIKSAQKLAFARIFEAGHLVPHDQPAGILDLVDRWIAGEFRK